MNEQQAREWIAARWGQQAIEKLTRFANLLLDEMAHQNLIAKSTIDELWSRHFLDSAQLVPMADAEAAEGAWVDIGSGAGLPGVVAAILQSRAVVMIEPRRKRVEFLQRVVDELNLNAQVMLGRAETVRPSAAAIVSARAVAPLDELFQMARSFTNLSTIWLLPKGRSAQSELADAQRTWHGVFHVEQSLTASDSQIVIARKVKRR